MVTIYIDVFTRYFVVQSVINVTMPSAVLLASPPRTNNLRSLMKSGAIRLQQDIKSKGVTSRTTHGDSEDRNGKPSFDHIYPLYLST